MNAVGFSSKDSRIQNVSRQDDDIEDFNERISGDFESDSDSENARSSLKMMDDSMGGNIKK